MSEDASGRIGGKSYKLHLSPFTQRPISLKNLHGLAIEQNVKRKARQK